VPVVLFKAHGHLPWSVRLCLPFIDRVVTSSQKGFAIDTPKRVVLGQAIDCGLFRPPEVFGGRPRGEAPRLCSAGRISPAKGYETLIAAAARLAGEGWRTLAVDIYGACATREDEAYLAGLRAQVERLGLTGQVRFRGPVPHARLPERLAECDLFVNLSATDSLDKAVLEAMACERPVLSSNLSCRELLEAHSPLLGFDRGDDAALAARIKALWSLPGAELARLGRGLRETVARDHGLGRFMDRLIGLFEELRAG
jgi:glycosyltransferase involved in cell wall biosynthesis